MKSPTPYQALVASLSTRFDAHYDVDARDLPALTDDQLAACVNHESSVAFDSFNPGYYAEILNSAVYLTETEKALAFWREFGRAARESAKPMLAESVTEDLVQWRVPVSA